MARNCTRSWVLNINLQGNTVSRKRINANDLFFAPIVLMIRVVFDCRRAIFQVFCQNHKYSISRIVFYVSLRAH